MASRRKFDDEQLVAKMGESTSSALLALTRLLARQAARETLTSPPLDSGEPADGEA